MVNILNNITLLRDDLNEKGWCITAFDFTYKKIQYIVVFEVLNKQLQKNKYYIAQLKFINTNNNSELITLANSKEFNISAVAIRKFFNVEYIENLGDFEIQFYKNFAKYIPTSFHLPTHGQLDQVIDILNDRDNDNNKYCYAVKRNGKNKDNKQMHRTIFNDNKTRLLRPSLYDHFKNDTTVSFCYKPLPSDHKDDSTILLNFSKNQKQG